MLPTFHINEGCSVAPGPYLQRIAELTESCDDDEIVALTRQYADEIYPELDHRQREWLYGIVHSAMLASDLREFAEQQERERTPAANS